MSYLDRWKATNNLLQVALNDQREQLRLADVALGNGDIQQNQRDAQWIEFNTAERAANVHITQLEGYSENLGDHFDDINAVRGDYAKEGNPYASLTDAEVDDAFTNLSQESIQVKGFKSSNPYQYSSATIDGVRYDSHPIGPGKQFNTDTPEGAFQEALINPKYRNELGKEAMLQLAEAITKSQLAKILIDHPILNKALQEASLGDALEETFFDDDSKFKFTPLDSVKDLNTEGDFYEKLFAKNTRQEPANSPIAICCVKNH